MPVNYYCLLKQCTSGGEVWVGGFGGGGGFLLSTNAMSL